MLSRSLLQLQGLHALALKMSWLISGLEYTPFKKQLDMVRTQTSNPGQHYVDIKTYG